jgi:hypothetical protein
LIRTITPGHVLAFTAFLILPLAVMAPILLSSLFAVVGLATLILLFVDRRLANGIPWGFVAAIGLLLAWAGLSVLWSVDAAQSLKLAGKLLASLVGGAALVALARSLSAEERHMVESAWFAAWPLDSLCLHSRRRRAARSIAPRGGSTFRRIRASSTRSFSTGRRS